MYCIVLYLYIILFCLLYCIVNNFKTVIFCSTSLWCVFLFYCVMCFLLYIVVCIILYLYIILFCVLYWIINNCEIFGSTLKCLTCFLVKHAFCCADSERQLEPEELPMQFCENGSKPLIFLRMKVTNIRYSIFTLVTLLKTLIRWG